MRWSFVGVGAFTTADPLDADGLSKVDGWGDRSAAVETIVEARRRFREHRD
jgi:hypothetical protein